MFESWRGRYADSPRAISERLAQRRPDLQQIWVAVPGAEFPDGIRCVRRHSPAYFARLLSADHLVANDIVSRHLLKGPRVSYLQTWHGTPLKTIGHDEPDPAYDDGAHARRMDRDVAKWDVLLSAGAECTEMFRSAFRFSGTVLESGLPRNDVLLSAEAETIGRSTRERLGIAPDARVVLWAPTWRDDLRTADGGFAPPGGLDPEEFLARSHPSTVLLVRMHSVVAARRGSAASNRLIDVSDHPEIAELYLASDALVSDYSSAVYDFAVTGRPILLLAPDLEHYSSVRPLYFDYRDWAPGPVVESTAELADAVDAALDAPGRDQWVHERAAFVERFCPNEDGGATDRVIDAVFGADS